MMTDDDLDQLRARMDAGNMTRGERQEALKRLREDADELAQMDADDDDLDDDEIEFWEDDRDGTSRGARMPVRVARQYAPEHVKGWLARQASTVTGAVGDTAGKLTGAEVGEPRPPRPRRFRNAPRTDAGTFTGSAPAATPPTGKRFVAGRRVG